MESKNNTNCIYTQNRDRLRDKENKHGYQKGEGREKGQIRSTGLTEIN